MDKDFNRTFTKCPCCGSGFRFFEELGKELKERKLAGENWNYRYETRQGPVVDMTKEPAYPIGTELPTFGIITDVCMDCGCMYAIDLRRGSIKKPAPITTPANRAQRRRDERGGPGLILPGNN